MFKQTVRQYFDRIYDTFRSSDAREESYYTILEDLINEYAKDAKVDVGVRILPKKTEAGNPDFAIWRNQKIVGYIEAKIPQEKLDTMEATEQIGRYLTYFPNFILTNFIEFRLYRNGRMVDIVSIARQDTLLRFATKPPLENEDKLKDLFDKFFSFSLPRTFTAESLAEELAKKTHFLRDIVELEFDAEQPNGVLHGFFDAFKKYLIADLEEKQFIDLFSQTIVYGLFAARMRADGAFDRVHAYERIPKTIGILRELFKFISIEENLPKQMEWAVDDIVNLLAAVDVKQIFDQYYHSGTGEDPVVYFYETFLATYDPEERNKRGVYYTPKPVVEYIVKSVNEILKDKMGISSGLADDRVTVLDPAAGTLSFITESVKLAIKEYTSRFGIGAKNKFVKEHILRDFYAFELMVAPYTIGHIKFAFTLEEEGYTLADDERPKFYLTNTLEMKTLEKTNLPLMSAISEESHLAEQVKKEIPILAIIGNPPYSGISSNTNEWTEKLLKTDVDGVQSYYMVDDKPLGERKVMLQDDYVKFIRFAQWKIAQSGEGIIGFITNHSYIDNPTFRGMRQSLMKTFNEIYILNLHGNAKKREKSPDGSKDENVFDIQQGVAIALFVKRKNETGCNVFYSEIWGQREQKYNWLSNNSFKSTDWKEIYPSSPFYFFTIRNEEGREVYEKCPKINEIFIENISGVETARDNFAIAFKKEELMERISLFIDPKISDDEFRKAFHLEDKKQWKMSKARKLLMDDTSWEKYFKEIIYRPFDKRFIFYNNLIIHRLREQVMKNMLKDNLGLITVRQVAEGVFNHAFVADTIIDRRITWSDKGAAYLFPIYIYKTVKDEDLFSEATFKEAKKEPNIKIEIFDKLKETYSSDITPEQIFYYIYAVLYSNTYRTKYAEFLKIDFPRVPFTANYNLFIKLSELGEELVSLHLLKSSKLDNPIAKYGGKGNDAVVKVQYNVSEKRVYINANNYFDNVEPEVYSYYIGGYQVLNKWLKDRVGRILSLSEIETYCKIVTALSETLALQSQLDSLYPEVEKTILEVAKE